MIYEFPKNDEPIRQGDIFRQIPHVDLSLGKLPVIIDQNRPVLTTWEKAAVSDDPVLAIVSAKPVNAIVITQDCDASRAEDITLCEIRQFRTVERRSADMKSNPEKWMRLLTQQARINQKWFYLPPDPHLGFTDKMGVDFLVTLRVLRLDLEALRHQRKGRLNDVALAHFRERIAEFYRRYPYDEWYALDKDELKACQKDHPGSQPYRWQTTA